ncbi:MAG TPA: DUF2147 domain-containing protein [Hyphomicrobiales bacterium]|nr:DUF2147 domain-containing protein [Hyphomicrobiales bacterium]
MKMVRLILAAAFVSALAIAPAMAQKAEDAFGVWEHPDNGSHIRISKCGGGLCAKIIKVEDPSRTDVKNPNPAKRKRPIVGITIMSGAKKSGEATWSGKLYNTLDGETYNGTVTVLSKKKLKLQGCVLGGLICQGPTWTRVN